MIETYIREISDSLKLGKWIPEPYLRIEIPKKDNEKRKLGLLSVKDKIVQQAIKMLVEPYFENEFVDNSYGYRPNKGHYKAVQRAWSECKKKKYNFFLKLDIDNFFDTINHDYLAALVRRHWSSIFISITKGIILSLMRNSRHSRNSSKVFKSP